MRNIYKNPVFYYVLVPAVTALWPLLVWGVYLPRAQRSWDSEMQEYSQAQTVMADIRTLDPDRLGFDTTRDAEKEFAYATAVEKIAALCKVPTSSYKLSSGIITSSSGQKSQSAKVILEGVDITQFARFLSAIQLRWANLQCAQIKLTKNKGAADKWNVDLQFKYYY